MRKNPKDYEIGDEAIDSIINQLAKGACSTETGCLLREILLRLLS